jgi:threonine/homoserine/homoserine lactone efflux protein
MSAALAGPRRLFATSLLVGFSGALTPGPLLAATVAFVTTRGFWSGPALVLGHGILELVVVLALVRGLGRVLARPGVTRTIAAAGGAGLLLFAALMITAGLAGSLSLAPQVGAAPAPGFSLWEPVLVGAGVSVANPYWVLWWATAGAGYLAIALRTGTAGLVAFYTGHVLSDLLWYTAVAAVLAAGGRLLGPSLYNAAVVAAGGFLALMGCVFLRFAARRPAGADSAESGQ